MDIVKQRIGLLVERCAHCHQTVVIAGMYGMMMPDGVRLICERCAEVDLPGTRGHDLPAFAVEWAQATGTLLDASVCAREWRAWEIEAQYAERSGQPEVAVLAQQRSRWMLEAYQAFKAVEREL